MANTLDFGPIYTSTGGISQIEYAQKCADSGNTCIALKNKDSLLIFVEKPISKLVIDTHSVTKITNNCMVAVSGNVSDSKWVLSSIQNRLFEIKKMYGDIKPEDFKKVFTNTTSLFTRLHGTRVLGVNFLIGLNFRDEYHIFSSDCTTKMRKYHSWAVGKGSSRAKTEIEKLKLEEMSYEELLDAGIKILYMSHDPLKDLPFDIEICTINKKNDNMVNWLNKSEYAEIMDKYSDLTVDD